MVQRTRAAARRLRRKRVGTLAMVVLGVLALLGAIAVADNRGVDAFELDGDLATGSSLGGGGGITGPGLDWAWSSQGADDGALTFDPTAPVDGDPSDGSTNPTDNPLTGGSANFFQDDLKVDPDGTTFTNGNKEDDFANVTVFDAVTGALQSDTPWSIVSGSVPPNKDDLFNVYDYTRIFVGPGGVEADVVLAFNRTNNLGSSHVDFEINRLPWVPCASDPTRDCPRRVEGDILISYEISPNSIVPTIFRWDLPGGIDGGGAGSPGEGVNCQGFLATGGNRTKPCPWEEITVNPANLVAVLNPNSIAAAPWGSRLPNGSPSATIPVNGFFEVYIDFDALGFAPDCPGFSTVSAKSRSSDSVTSALQDLAGPFPIDLTTCGEIIIEKQTVPDGGTGFDFDHDWFGDPTGDSDFTLDDDETESSGPIAPGTYTVKELAAAGYVLTDISCVNPDLPGGPADADSSGNLGTRTATITVDPFETVKCTFTNEGQGTIVIRKETDPAGSAQSFDFSHNYADNTGDPDGVADFSLTDYDGSTGPEQSNLLTAGTYKVTELGPPDGWTFDSVSCDDTGSSTSGATAIIDLDPGETVICTFSNSIGAIDISKVTKNATLGTQPLANVTFEVTDGDDVVVATVVTDANGQACVDGLVVGDTYTVTETDAPTGYDPANVDPQDIVAAAGTCDSEGDPADADFTNDPLSKLTITFESLAGDGVTIVTDVSCVATAGLASEGGGFSSGDLGDLGDDQNPESVVVGDALLEGTYVCTIVIDP